MISKVLQSAVNRVLFMLKCLVSTMSAFSVDSSVEVSALRPKYYFISILLVSPLLYNCSKYLLDLLAKLKGNVAEETSVSHMLDLK